MAPDRIRIFDTTLRDGEQSPKASMGKSAKLEIAHALKDLGVDVIEAGFPVSSLDDFEAVSEIASTIRGPVIAALARCNRDDIFRAAGAVQPAERSRIHVFIGTSPIHREHKLHMSQDMVLYNTLKGVQIAREYTDDVEFSPEDAGRTEPDFLARVVEQAIKAGATTVNIPDTVGYCEPDEFRTIIEQLMNRVPDIDKATVSVHCHNDLGMAVANSLAAVKAGARQIECTINGIGERAGNTSLEEVVMALKTRYDRWGVESGINTKLLKPTSDLVAKHTWHVQRNKAIVGANAFAHEAGIHQDGMLKHRETYEIMNPEDIGWKETELVLGKHSGWGAIRDRFTKYHLPYRMEDKETFMRRFKDLADGKVLTDKYVTDEELLEQVYYPTVIEITGGNFIQGASRNDDESDGRKKVLLRTSIGDVIHGIASTPEEGVVSAMVNGMKQIIPNVNVGSGEEGYREQSIGEGADAAAQAWFTLHNAFKVTQSAIHPDTEMAKQQALIACFNALYALEQYAQMIEKEAQRGT